jgi:hypothetical protein
MRNTQPRNLRKPPNSIFCSKDGGHVPLTPQQRNALLKAITPAHHLPDDIGWRANSEMWLSRNFLRQITEAQAVRLSIIDRR